MDKYLLSEAQDFHFNTLTIRKASFSHFFNHRINLHRITGIAHVAQNLRSHQRTGNQDKKKRQGSITPDSMNAAIIALQEIM